MHEITTKEKVVREVSEIRVRMLKYEEICTQILNKETKLCTNLKKPTKLHEDRHSKTSSSFDNYLIILKSMSIKIISKFSTNNCIC